MINAEETLRGPKRDVIFYELNEVPWRVVDYYIERRPDSHMVAMPIRTASGHREGEGPVRELDDTSTTLNVVGAIYGTSET